MQKKRDGYNQMKNKASLHVTVSHVIIVTMQTGLIDSSVSIAEKQRSALNPNCTAQTLVLATQGRTRSYGEQKHQLKCKNVAIVSFHSRLIIFFSEGL